MGPDAHRELAEISDINTWIKTMLAQPEIYAEPDWGPLSEQWTFVYDSDRKTKLVTEVFRFENYQQDLKTVLKKLNREDLIPKIQKTNHSLKRNFELTQESIDLIKKYFKNDYELFGY